MGYGGQWGYYTDNELDQVTGVVPQGRLAWTLNGLRYYDPATGRFLTRDPVGYEGGINLYTFCGNNPVNYIDPLGLEETGSYFGDVGQVLLGYSDLVNPVKWYQGAKSLVTIAKKKGLVAAAKAVGSGTYHAYTDFLTTDDPRTFGQSFGTVLATVAAAGAGKAVSAPIIPAEAGTEIVQRVMSTAELQATKSTGLLRGGRSGEHFVSDAINGDPLRARQRLSLKQTPEHRVTLEVEAGKFSAASKVKPHYKMPGGGSERTATGNIPVKIIKSYRY